MGEKQETLKESRKNSDRVIVILRCVCLCVIFFFLLNRRHIELTHPICRGSDLETVVYLGDAQVLPALISECNRENFVYIKGCL